MGVSKMPDNLIVDVSPKYRKSHGGRRACWYVSYETKRGSHHVHVFNTKQEAARHGKQATTVRDNSIVHIDCLYPEEIPATGNGLQRAIGKGCVIYDHRVKGK